MEDFYEEEYNTEDIAFCRFNHGIATLCYGIYNPNNSVCVKCRKEYELID